MKNETLYLLVGFILFILGSAIYYRIRYSRISSQLQLVSDRNTIEIRQLNADRDVLRKGYLDVGKKPPV